MNFKSYFNFLCFVNKCLTSLYKSVSLSYLETSRVVFSSRRPRACMNGFLKKLDLSFPFLVLRLLMHSVLHRLARPLLISSQRTFQPSLSQTPAFLKCLRSCLLLANRSLICFYLLHLCLCCCLVLAIPVVAFFIQEDLPEQV